MSFSHVVDDVLKASLLVEKYSMVATQTILGTVMAMSALDFVGRAVVISTGSPIILKNVKWLASTAASLGLPSLALHGLSISLFLLFSSTVVKCFTSAYLNRNVSWENWRLMRPDISCRCD